jgi:hypothetical protein
LVFAAGNPRQAAGSMNDMRKHLAWKAERPHWVPVKNEEDWINRTPFLSLLTKFPDKEFARRLADAEGPTGAPSPMA